MARKRTGAVQSQTPSAKLTSGLDSGVDSLSDGAPALFMAISQARFTNFVKPP
jgi:hypothetical protein